MRIAVKCTFHFPSVNFRPSGLSAIPHPSRTNFGLRFVYRVGLGLGLVFIFV